MAWGLLGLAVDRSPWPGRDNAGSGELSWRSDRLHPPPDFRLKCWNGIRGRKEEQKERKLVLSEFSWGAGSDPLDLAMGPLAPVAFAKYG